MHSTDTTVNLSNGGSAVVVTAPDFECPRPFDVHPQLCVLRSRELPITLDEIASKFPANTRLVVIGGELPRHAFGLVRQVAQQRQVPYLTRTGAAALTNLLRDVLAKPPGGNGPATPAAAAADAAPPTEERRKGQISAFVHAEADLTKSSAEEARRLMALAQQRGLHTTFGSLSIAIGKAKRKAGATGVPRSIQPANVKALNTLTDSIAGLQLVAEWVETVEKENAALRIERDGLKMRLGKALKAVQELQ